MIGKYSVNLIWYGCGEVLYKVGSNFVCGFFVQFNEGEFGCLVDCYQQVQIVLFGLNFGQIDVEVVDGIGFEFFFDWFFVFVQESFVYLILDVLGLLLSLKQFLCVVWFDLL